MHTKPILHAGISTLVALLLLGCTSYAIGNKELKKNNYRAAITHYLEYLSKNPGHCQARVRLGFAYLKIGQLDESVQEFNHVLQQRPENPSAKLYLGLAWLHKGEFDRTVEIWRSYENKRQPLVEDEIKYQLTQLEIAENQQLGNMSATEISANVERAVEEAVAQQEAVDRAQRAGTGGGDNGSDGTGEGCGCR